jgi:dTDP-4-amino-4,6-dideoxygalactose transaminase
MNRFESILKTRIASAAYYNRELAEEDLIRLPATDNNRKANYQTYPAFVSNGRKNEIINLLKNRNIEAGIGSYSIPHTGYYREKYNFSNTHFPEALNAFGNLISLPLFDGISRGEQDYVIDALHKIRTSKLSPVLQSA